MSDTDNKRGFHGNGQSSPVAFRGLSAPPALRVTPAGAQSGTERLSLDMLGEDVKTLPLPAPGTADHTYQGHGHLRGDLHQQTTFRTETHLGFPLAWAWGTPPCPGAQ